MVSPEPFPESFSHPKYIFALWNLVIRPPRTTYTTRQLGPSEFKVAGIPASRRDVRLRTPRGTKLECSHYVPHQDLQYTLKKLPVVIYLHGNSSSRLEAANLVATLIAQRISLFCFDAAGCGLSEGDYVSLGWHERDDLAVVIQYLRRSPLCGPIGLWGRSMGAATALLHADRDPSLCAMMLDSAFADFGQLVEELAQSERMPLPIPGWLVSAALELIRARVRALADFDIMDLKPVEHAKRSYIPALFVHARDDDFISPTHSQLLFDAYSGDRELITIAGTHNSARSRAVVAHAVRFFRRAFRLEDLDVMVIPRQFPATGDRCPRPVLQPMFSNITSQPVPQHQKLNANVLDVKEENLGFVQPARARRATMPSQMPQSCGDPAPLPPPVAPSGATGGAFGVTTKTCPCAGDAGAGSNLHAPKEPDLSDLSASVEDSEVRTRRASVTFPLPRTLARDFDSHSSFDLDQPWPSKEPFGSMKHAASGHLGLADFKVDDVGKEEPLPSIARGTDQAVPKVLRLARGGGA